MRVYLLIVFLASSVLCGKGQSPADGRIEGHAYVNTYLHFTYTWPSILHPQDTGLLHIGPHSNPNEALLFAARQGSEPYGVVVLSEKLNTPWQNFSGFKDGPDFLRRIPIGQSPEDHFRILASKHAMTPDGLSVDELDYAIAAEFASGITVRIGDYIVVFKCNAASLEDLDTMTKSILAVRRTK
jgi:hypothetical protein